MHQTFGVLAYPAFPSSEDESIIGFKRFHFPVPALEIFVCPRTLLSPRPKTRVLSGHDDFTSLFGMGKGGTRHGKTRANENFSISSRHNVGIRNRNPAIRPAYGREKKVGHV